MSALLKLRAIVSIALVAVFLGLAAWYANAHSAELREFQVTDPRLALGVGFFFFCNMVLRGSFVLYVMRAFNVHLSAAESFHLSAATSMANFLLPLRGGALMRAYYLKRCHGLPYMAFASSMVALYVLTIFVSTGIGLIAAIVLAASTSEWIPSILILLGAIFAGSGWSIFLCPDIPPTDRAGWRYLRKVSTGWDTIRRSRQVLWAAIITVVGSTICAVGGFYLALIMFSVETSLVGCVLLTSSQQVGSLVSLTPGALGFQEMVGMYFSKALPATMLETFAALTAVRIIKILVAVLFGIPGLLLLSRRPSMQGAVDAGKVTYE